MMIDRNGQTRIHKIRASHSARNSLIPAPVLRSVARVSDLAPLVGMKQVTIYLHKSQQVNVPKELEEQVERL